jgi:CheY-like chemotaxis protein
MQKNVLLIESDTTFARAMSSALESRGYGVRTSPDGKEGFELARALHPDCVVLCVELPGLSGYSWCNRLKKDGTLKSIPLVITSSEATPETFDQHRKLKTRAEDYLLKPFQPETLVERVGALVGLPEATPEDEELITLDDVELEGAAAEAAPLPPEDDVDLKALDDAFDSISRGGDEPSAHAPGAPASEPPITLMPDADESPALSDFDRDMASALASLAEEAAEASRAAPLVPPAAPDPFLSAAPPPPPPPPRRVAPRVESVALEETPVLLEDVEVLPGVDENEVAVLLAAQQEVASLRSEVSELQEAGARVRQEADVLREEASRLRVEAEEAQRLLALRDTEAATLRGRLDAAVEQSARVQEQLARAGERTSEQEGELASIRSRLSAAELSATERGAELVDAERQIEEREREIEVARAEAEGLRAEIDSLRSSADGVRGEAAGLRNEVATLGATVDGLRSEVGALRGASDAQRAEADGLRSELQTVRAEADGLRSELRSARADVEARGAEADAIRSETDGLRASAEAFRAQAEGRATELSLRIQELEGQAAQLEDRILRAYQKIKSDEKIREKTRKALAMVLQILEDRPGGEGGSTPPAS